MFEGGRSCIELTTVNTAHARIVDYLSPQKFDTLVTRAFSSLSDMLNWTAPVHQTATRFLAMKGKRPDDEIDALPAMWQDRVHIRRLQVPYLDAERHLVEINLKDLYP